MRHEQAVVLLLLALVLGGGCANPPLGEDWEHLAQPERRQRAVETVGQVFGNERARGLGPRYRPDKEIVALDDQSVAYRDRAGEGGSLVLLRYQDITDVTFREDPTLPGRVGSLRVYLRSGSPSTETKSVRSPLIEGDHVLLRNRTHEQYRALKQALQELAGPNG